MKNLTDKLMLLSLAIVLCFTSCNDNVTIPKAEYEKLIGDTLRSEYPKPFKLYTEGLSSFGNSHGIVLGSDNHEYLVWNFGSHGCNVEHYIDCKLCETRLLKAAADKEYDRLNNLIKAKSAK
jgi:hypothetical protein